MSQLTHSQGEARKVVILNRQLLDEDFAISGIIKAELCVISRSRKLRLITLTQTFMITPDITKSSSNNCLLLHIVVTICLLIG